MSSPSSLNWTQGENVTFRVILNNEGQQNNTGLSVRIPTPSGFTFSSVSNSSHGNYSNGEWNLENAVSSSVSSSFIDLEFTINSSFEGIINLESEVSSMNEVDVDSEPNNDDYAEDDISSDCISVPYQIVCNSALDIEAPVGYSSYGWYKDGNLINGANSRMYTVTEEGSYTYELLNGQTACGASSCCPVIVEFGSCTELGSFVWNDLNANGLQDTNEPGISNVEVLMYDASDDTLLGTTFTDNSGMYLIENVEPGEIYLVFNPNTVPTDFIPTTQNYGSDETIDSDILNTTDGRTEVYTIVAGVDNLDIDAGYYSPSSIEGLVWLDDNLNNLYETNETKINGVEVNLYKGNGTLVATATTTTIAGIDGSYSFSLLAPGDYYIVFDHTSGVISTPDYIPTFINQGSNENIDSDANETTGITDFIQLGANENISNVYAGYSDCEDPIASSDTDICEGEGQSVQLSVTGGNGNYRWAPSVGLSCVFCPNPVANPAYTITYTVTSSEGSVCEASDEVTINVLEGETALFSADENCPGSVTNFTTLTDVNASDNFDYLWVFGDPSTGSLNTDTDRNPSHMYNNPGEYNVTLILTDENGCKDTLVQEIEIEPLPLVELGDDIEICEGLSTNLVALVTGNVTYDWTPTTGLSNYSIPNPVASPSVTTTYTLEVTDALGCTSSDDITIEVKNSPATASVSGINPTNCNSIDGVITVNASGAGPFEYSINSGSNFQSSNVFTNLGPGTYYVTTRYLNGTQCPTQFPDNPVILTAPSAPSINDVAFTNPTDCGQEDGTITVTANGGSGTYEYSIDAGNTWQTSNYFSNIDGLTSYEVAVRNDDGSCLTLGQIINMEIPTQPVVSNITINDPTDCDAIDGKIEVIASSSSSNLMLYSIDGGNTYSSASIFYNLPAGPYTIFVKNENNTCPINAGTVTLVEPIEPILEGVTSIDPTDCNVNDGIIEINATISLGNLEYSIDNGITWHTNSQFTGLDEGTYLVKVRNDLENCEVGFSETIALNKPTAPSISSFIAENPSDCGSSDGSITINSTLGSGASEYSIDGGNTWQIANYFGNLDGLVSYELAVRNSVGSSCKTLGDIINLEVPEPPTITSIGATDLSDCASDDGRIEILVNAPEALKYSIDNGNNFQNSNIFYDLAQGTYNVQIKYLNGTCIMNGAPITISEPDTPIISAVNVSNSTDCNQNDGAIEILATTTEGTLEYSIDGGFTWATTNVFTNLNVGNYQIFVRKSNGTCIVNNSSTIEIEEPLAPTIDNLTQTNPSDCGQDDGTITITASNFDGNIEYSINGGNSWQTSGTFENLAGGTFSPRIRNQSGQSCEVAGQVIELVAPMEPVIVNVTNVDPSDCGNSDGSIEIQAGGTGAFRYSIDGGQTFQSNNLYTNLSAGTYQIRVQNIDGTCTISNSDAILVEPTMPSIVSVSLTDASNCVGNDGTISITSNPTNNIEYSIDGGFSWSSNSVFNNLFIGNYEVVIRNFGGSCEMNHSSIITITAPGAPFVQSVDASDPSDCNVDDGSIVVNAMGGSETYEYSIDGVNWQLSDTFSNLAGNATYLVSIRNESDESCATEGQPVTLTSPVAPTIVDILGTNPTNCNTANGQIEIQALSNSPLRYSINGGANYQSSNIFYNLQPGTYNIAVSNANGTCEVAGNQLVIDSIDEPEITDIAIMELTECNGSDAQINISANNNSDGLDLEYTIDGGVTWVTYSNFTGLSSGNYQIGVRYSGQICEIIESTVTVILEPEIPSIVEVSFVNPSDCNASNGSIIITVNNGSGILEYSIDGQIWQTSNIFENLNGAIIYNTFVRNQGFNGTCFKEGEDVVMDVPVIPVVNSVNSIDPSGCENNDGRIIIDASGEGALQFSIDNGLTYQNSNIFYDLEPGIYMPVVRNLDGSCEVGLNDEIIDEIDSPTIDDVVFTDPSNCMGLDGSINIVATAVPGTTLEYSINGGFSFQSSSLFENLSPGNYQVTIRINNGICQINNSELIMINTISSPSLTSVNYTNPSDCGQSDGTITLMASGGNGMYEYSIDGTNWQTNNVFVALDGNQSYVPLVRNSNDGSCESSGQTIDMDVPVVPAVNNIVVTDPTNCNTSDGTIEIQTTPSSGLRYSIDNGASFQVSNIYYNLSPGDYNIIIKNIDETCLVNEGIVTINSLEEPEISDIHSTNPSDCNLNDGIIIISATSQSSNSIEYSIDGGFTWSPNNTFVDLGQGTYQISIRYDDNTCLTNNDQVVELIDPIAPVITNVAYEDPQNCGVDDGRILISVNGGSGSYEYSIDGTNWQTSNLFTNLGGDQTYLTYVRNSNGTCEVQGQDVVLNLPEIPAVDTVVTINPNECGIDNGQITINATSNVGLRYSIDGGNSFQSSNVFQGLAEGSYDIVVTKVDGTCEVQGGIETLVAPEPGEIVEITSTNPTDCGLNDGNINISANQGSSTLEYSIDGGFTWASTSLFENLGTGNYLIKIRNIGGGCVVNYETVISLITPNSPIISDISYSNPTNCGLSDGIITILAVNSAGESSGIEYSIDGGSTFQNSNEFLGLTGGNYLVVVRNADESCEIMGSTISIVDPILPIISNVVIQHETDCGLDDGRIEIVAQGNQTIEYSIDNGSSWQQSPIFNNLESGTFDISIRFLNGTCHVDHNTQIEIDGGHSTPIISGVNVENASNCEVNDGTIEIFATGDQDLEFSIDNGLTWATNNIFDNLSPGTYITKVRYSNSQCEVDFNENPVTVSAPSSPTLFDVDYTEITDCGEEDGTIIIYAEEGEGQSGIEYSITGINGQFFEEQNIFENLAPGSYQIVIRNTDSTCTIEYYKEIILIDIQIPLISEVEYTHPTDCSEVDGQIIVNADEVNSVGDYEFSIDGGITYQSGNTFTGLIGGEYDVYVRHTNNTCSVNYGIVSLEEPIVPEYNIIVPVEVEHPSNCESLDGAITINATDSEGGTEIEFSINGGSSWSSTNTFSGLADGSYTVQIRNIDTSCEVLYPNESSNYY